MNERIKELAEQADAYAWEQIDLGANFDEQPRYFAEKFAQLIVKECADWLKQPVNQIPTVHISVMNIKAEKLKEHFGVKE